MLGLSALTLSLTLSTYFRISPGIFFTFVLVNGMAQAALGSYLQTSVIAVASLFGPATVQSLMLGQAAVAVIISGVQVITAAASTWGDKGASAVATKDAEAMSAFVFFGLSTIFLLATVGIQRWLMTLSIYQSVVRSLEVQHTRVDGVADEHHSLVSGEGSKFHTDRKNILRVARANALYELAVAYVFVVTLVGYLFLPANPLPFIFSGRVPPYHSQYRNCVFINTRAAIQCRSLSHVCSGRFTRSISLFHPQLISLVTEASSSIFAC